MNIGAPSALCEPYPRVKLGSVATVRSGYAFKTRDWTDQGVPVVKIANVKAGRLAMDSSSFVNEGVAQKASAYRLNRGDILIGMTGYVGEVARVDTDDHMVLNQRVGRFSITAPDRLDREFLYQALLATDARDQIVRLSHGSAQANISPRLIESVSIPLPPLALQRRIAAVLGTLDAKITANRVLATRLDAIAQVTFDNAVRHADESWTDVQAKDVANVNAKSHSAKSHPEELYYLDIASTSTRCIDRLECLAWGDAPSRARRIVSEGDTLISTVRPERRSFVHVPSMPEPITASTGFAVISPDAIDPSFLYRSMTSDKAIGYFAASAGGSAYPAVSAALIAAWEFPTPSDAGAAYGAVAGPIEAQRWDLLRQNIRLAALRDELLPRLVSGKIRVADDYLADESNEPSAVLE